MSIDKLKDAVTYADAAMASIARHSLPPDPVNFAVWYNFHSNRDPGLRRALDTLMAVDAKITSSITHEIYDSFLSPTKLYNLSRSTAEKLEITMEKLLLQMDGMDENARGYGDRLASFSGALDRDLGTEKIAALVRAMQTDTRDMAERNRALEQQLAESNAELGRLREEFQRAKREAMTDPLTGLANRKSFADALGRAMATSDALAEHVTLMMIDIDHFKRVNDQHGHLAGDVVLQYLGRLLVDNIKGQDVAARYGGEEFAVLLPRTHISQAQQLADTIRRLLAGKRLIKRSSGEPLGQITLSVGVAQYRPGETADDLIRRADEALYVAKRSGRNRVCIEEEAGPAVHEA